MMKTKYKNQPCQICGNLFTPEHPHYAKGMHNNCYQTNRKPKKKKNIPDSCQICGNPFNSDNPHYVKGKHRNCYHRDKYVPSENPNAKGGRKPGRADIPVTEQKKMYSNRIGVKYINFLRKSKNGAEALEKALDMTYKVPDISEDTAMEILGK